MSRNWHDPFGLLGLDPGEADRKVIKRAYAKKLKTIDPATSPQEFQQLREAYEAALRQADFIEAGSGLEQDFPANPQDFVVTGSQYRLEPNDWPGQGPAPSNRTDSPDPPIGNPEFLEVGADAVPGEYLYSGIDVELREEAESLLGKIRGMTWGQARAFSWQEILDHPLLDNPEIRERVEYEIYMLMLRFGESDKEGNLVLPGFVSVELIRLLDSKFGWINDYKLGRYETGIIDNQFWISLVGRFETRAGKRRNTPSTSIGFLVFFLIYLVVKALMFGFSDSSNESRHDQARKSDGALYQEMQNEARLADPRLPKSVFIAEAVLRNAERQAEEASLPFEKRDAAIIQFLGFHFFNTRMRFRYCRDLGVEIRIFSTEFRQAHQSEMAIALANRQIFRIGEKAYNSLYSLPLTLLVPEMNDIGTRLGKSPADTCRYVDENGASFVEENLLLSKIYPTVYEAIHTPDAPGRYLQVK